MAERQAHSSIQSGKQHARALSLTVKARGKVGWFVLHAEISAPCQTRGAKQKDKAVGQDKNVPKLRHTDCKGWQALTFHRAFPQWY